jgi:1-deoxy-D-xylulose-5-phosphate synthase
VPGLRIAAPRDGEQLREQLREATAVDDAPTVLRYPKGTVGAPVPAVGRISGMDVLRGADAVDAGANSGALADVLVVSVGALAPLCLEVAERLAEQGITTTVVDPRWVKPVDEALPGLAARHRLVVSVEDGVRVGGVGAAIAQALRDSGIEVPVRDFGVPAAFWEHASRHRVLAAAGLTASDIAREVTGTFARLAQTDQTEAPTLP